MIVAVTGQARSGASALAGMLHHLGVPMGALMMMPNSPSMTLEWEDWAFTEPCVRGQEVDWSVYMRDRAAFHRGGPWGMKSPFLALNVHELEAGARALGQPLHWLLVVRAQDEIDASLAPIEPHHVVNPELNREVRDAMRGIKGLVIEYERVVAHPLAEATWLAEVLDIEPSPEQLRRAADTIVRR